VETPSPAISGASNFVAISNYGYKNLTVKNGIVREFGLGIHNANGDSLNVNGITFEQMISGLDITDSSEARVNNNKFFDMRASAIYIINRDTNSLVNFNYVTNNEFYRTNTAVDICGPQADKNIVRSNLIWKSTWGVSMRSSNHNLVTANRILSSKGGASSIVLMNSSNNVINDNSIFSGENYGFLIGTQDTGESCLDSPMRTNFNRIENNYISDFKAGIWMYGSSSGENNSGTTGNNLIRNNNVLDNQSFGIYLKEGTYDNDARDNDFEGNFRDVSDSGVGNLY